MLRPMHVAIFICRRIDIEYVSNKRKRESGSGEKRCGALAILRSAL
jgi:hypothetical protein